VVREEGRPRALLPRPDVDPLAKDLGGVVFAGVLLLDTPVFDTVFLEAVGFPFLEAGVLFAADRPRALVPRPDLEAVLFGDLAIYGSFELGSPAPVQQGKQPLATTRAKRAGRPCGSRLSHAGRHRPRSRAGKRPRPRRGSGRSHQAKPPSRDHLDRHVDASARRSCARHDELPAPRLRGARKGSVSVMVALGHGRAAARIRAITPAGSSARAEALQAPTQH
jgi:hypothetical protein